MPLKNVPAYSSGWGSIYSLFLLCGMISVFVATLRVQRFCMVKALVMCCSCYGNFAVQAGLIQRAVQVITLQCCRSERCGDRCFKSRTHRGSYSTSVRPSAHDEDYFEWRVLATASTGNLRFQRKLSAQCTVADFSVLSRLHKCNKIK